MDSITRGMIGVDGDATTIDESSKRARMRDSLFLTAGMRVGDDATMHDVRVRNLSEGGLMVEFDRIVSADTVVILDVRGIGEIGGRVAWCTEGRLGIALDTPIDPKKARKPVGAGKPVPFYVKPALATGPRR